MSGKSRYRGPRGGKGKPNPLFNPAFRGGGPPWTTPPGRQLPFGSPGGPPGDDPIARLMGYMQTLPQLIVCGRFGLKPLTYEERHELLSAVNLYDALETVARVQGQWDLASITPQGPQAVNDVECEFLSGGGEGGLCERVLNRIIIYGDILLSPRATAQLQREIIESGSTDHAAPAIDRNTLTHLLLSITTEQNSDDEFEGDVPTPAEIARFQRKLPKTADKMHDYAKPHIQNEIASMLFNQPLRSELVLSNTYDLWFNEWAPKSNTTGLGDTPAEAFKIATGVELLDFMRLGHRIVKRSTKTHQVRFTRDELLADGATADAIDLLFANTVRPLDDYRVELEGDRHKGAVGNQRYTLTRFPFVAIDDNSLVMLRHQWALDRLCGAQLYFEAWASFSTGALRNRFKTAMCDAFEVFVGGILHRIFKKCPHLTTIVDESEMQAGWKKKKNETPSVCDWMIFGKGHCIVIDATNRAVKEDAAQGLATWDDYSTEIEEIFTDGKFGQLLSTIDLVKEHDGWGEEEVDTKTMYTPLVVVPDAGVVNGLLTQFDIVMRGLQAFGHLQPQVYAPGIVPLSDIQLLEGMADYGARGGKNPDMMDLIAKWRTGATKYGMASLQLFLLSYGTPFLPVSDHMVRNSRKVTKMLDAS